MSETQYPAAITRSCLLAYCDVADHLQCYQSIVRERERYGNKWSKQWARQSSRNRVISELSSVLAVHATPVDTGAFPSWNQYLQTFLKSGKTAFIVCEMRIRERCITQEGP